MNGRIIVAVLVALLFFARSGAEEKPRAPVPHPLGMVRDPTDRSTADYFSITDEEIAKHPKWNTLPPGTEIIIRFEGDNAKHWDWNPPTKAPPKPVADLVKIALDSKCPADSPQRKDWHVVGVRLHESYCSVLLQHVPRTGQPRLHDRVPVYLFLDGTIIPGKRGGAPAVEMPDEVMRRLEP
jgi:hypothetical protein